MKKLNRGITLIFEGHRNLEIMSKVNYKIFQCTVHVETVVKLVRKTPDAYIDITVDMDELDLTASEAKVWNYRTKKLQYS